TRRRGSGPAQWDPVNRVRSGRKQLSAGPPVCRRGAWPEPTASTASWRRSRRRVHGPPTLARSLQRRVPAPRALTRWRVTPRVARRHRMRPRRESVHLGRLALAELLELFLERLVRFDVHPREHAVEPLR